MLIALLRFRKQFKGYEEHKYLRLTGNRMMFHFITYTLLTMAYLIELIVYAVFVQKTSVDPLYLVIINYSFVIFNLLFLISNLGVLYILRFIS
jgi:hypothetical protein